MLLRRRILVIGGILLLAALLTAGTIRLAFRPPPVPLYITADAPRPEFLPVYMADYLGCFRAENLVPQFVSGPDVPADAARVMLLDLTDFLYRSAGKARGEVVIGVLNARPALYLLSRAPEPDFRYSRLKGVAVVTDDPLTAPETHFACALKAHGLFLFRDVTPIANLPRELHPGVLEAGIAGYLVTAEPLATLLAAGGRLHIVASLGTALGDFPGAVVVAPRHCLADQRATLAAFMRALYRAQLYLRHYGPADAVPALARFFPDLDPELLPALVARLHNDGVWAPEPVLTEEAFNRVTADLAGLRRLQQPVSYTELVDRTLALEALERTSKPPKRAVKPGVTPAKP